MELDEPATQKQEQMTMQTEKDLEELAEREQDIRQLEVSFFLLKLFQAVKTHCLGYRLCRLIVHI